MHSFTQSPGALAMDHTHGQKAALLAFAKVVRQQLAHVRGAKGVQIQLARDGEFDDIGFIIRHTLIFDWRNT